MTIKLIQKHLFKGSQHFEIAGDRVAVRTKTPFRPEASLSIPLAELDPEPVINRFTLDFVSRANGAPLLSLQVGRPDTESFNDFVNTLKNRARAVYETASSLSKRTGSDAMAGNVFDEPPEDDESDGPVTNMRKRPINPDEIENAIRMLETYLNTQEIQPLLAALRTLQSDPDDESKLTSMLAAFNDLNRGQGAVLTYAPFIGSFFSSNPYSN